MNESEKTVSRAAVIHIVDDDDSICRALARLVRSIGMKARTFQSPREFLHQSDLSELQCLILDVHLPGMSGLDLYEHLLSIGRNVPVVFITAQPDETSRARARMYDAVAYLEKPFDENCLLSAIRAALLPVNRKSSEARPPQPARKPGPE
jgi:FixJ family two-component response regulator